MRRFQRVHHVQVMRPGLGPVFPRVRTGVAAHETLFPIGHRAGFIVTLERIAVVFALVAEQRAVAVDPFGIGHQAVEIIVAAFMAEVTQQRAVAFMHLFARALALGRIGFGDVQGDQAIVVAGHHALVRHAVFQELEGQARFGLGFFRGRGQVQLRQREQQAALGRFKTRPQYSVFLSRQVRDDCGQLARLAQLVRVIRRQHPVAHIVLHIVAALFIEFALVLAVQATPQAVVGLFEAVDTALRGLVAQRAFAVEAEGILKKDLLCALVAVEGFHGSAGKGGVGNGVY